MLDSHASTVRSWQGHARGVVRQLLAPDAGLPALLVRFVLAGGLATAVYLLVTMMMADVAGLPFQAALVIGFCAAFSVNFLVQRRFVWIKRERYLLPIHRQAGRFLLWSWTQYGATALATFLLPRLLGLPTEVVYVGMLCCIALVNFLMLRYAIFHAHPRLPEIATAFVAKSGRGIPATGAVRGNVPDYLTD